MSVICPLNVYTAQDRSVIRCYGSKLNVHTPSGESRLFRMNSYTKHLMLFKHQKAQELAVFMSKVNFPTVLLAGTEFTN